MLASIECNQMLFANFISAHVRLFLLKTEYRNNDNKITDVELLKQFRIYE